MILSKRVKLYFNMAIVTTLLFGSTGSVAVYAAASSSTPSQTAIKLAQTEKRDSTTKAKPATNFKVTLNGTKVTLSDPIIVENGSTLLPVRAIANLLGIDVGYDNTYKIAIASDDDTTLEIPLGTTKAVNNGNVVNINGSKSVLYNSKTYLPLRFVSEQLGIKINYTSATKTIAITTTGGTTTTTPTDKPVEVPPTTSKDEPAEAAPIDRNTPQAVFDSNRPLSEIDAKYLTSFKSESEAKKLLPYLNDTGADYAFKNMKYATVTMDMVEPDAEVNGITLVLKKNYIGASGLSNFIIMFKDGTTCGYSEKFPSGKTLNDINYFTFSKGKTILFVKPGKIDMSNLKSVQ